MSFPVCNHFHLLRENSLRPQLPRRQKTATPLLPAAAAAATETTSYRCSSLRLYYGNQHMTLPLQGPPAQRPLSVICIVFLDLFLVRCSRANAHFSRCLPIETREERKIARRRFSRYLTLSTFAKCLETSGCGPQDTAAPRFGSALEYLLPRMGAVVSRGTSTGNFEALWAVYYES